MSAAFERHLATARQARHDRAREAVQAALASLTRTTTMSDDTAVPRAGTSTRSGSLHTITLPPAYSEQNTPLTARVVMVELSDGTWRGTYHPASRSAAVIEVSGATITAVADKIHDLAGLEKKKAQQ